MKWLLFLVLCLGGCVPLEVRPAFDPGKYQKVMGLVDKGTLLLRSRDYPQAVAVFSVAAELLPLPAAYDGLGCAWMELGDYQKAEYYFWKAFEQDPEYWYSLGNLALLYQRVGEYRLARVLLDEVVENIPGDFQVRNNRGVLIAKSRGKGDILREGEFRDALFEFRKALALREHPLVLQNEELIRLQLRKKDGIDQTKER